ncbi:MAG: hypothetical protein IH612_02490 [Desulfofustis sp.]|nr:hypothetical protein [Desulfofustis sp.]
MKNGRPLRRVVMMASTMGFLLFVTWSAFAIGPNEVQGFSEVNFQGQSQGWVLTPDARHRLVPTILLPQNRVRSLKIGQAVAVRFFTLPDFQGYPGQTDIVRGNIPNLGGSGGAQSLIIFPSNQQRPAGLQLLGRTTGNIKVPVGSFFPLPEYKKNNDSCYAVVNWIGNDVYPVEIHGEDMAALLFQGKSCMGEGVRLPGDRGTTAPVTFFEPSQWPLSLLNRHIESVKVFSAPPLVFKPAPVKLKTIQDMQVVEPAKGVNPQPKVGGAAKQAPPDSAVVINVSGTWKSNINRTYMIAQKGMQITWIVPNSDEQGTGSVSGIKIQVSWKSALGNGSAEGQITKVDSTSLAREIVWGNGVVFSR